LYLAEIKNNKMLHYLSLISLFCFLIAKTHTFAESTQQAAYASDSTEEEASLNTEYAQLQLVDKVTGKFQLIDAKVGETTLYQALNIKVATCRKSAIFEPPESKAFITILEYPKEAKPQKLFSGWMLASSPALSTLTDHPRYNVWLIKCTNKLAKPEKN